MKTKRLILAILGITLLSTQSFAQLQIEKKGLFDASNVGFLTSAFTEYDDPLILMPEYLSNSKENPVGIIIKDLNGNDIKSLEFPKYTYNSTEYYKPVSCECDTVIEMTDFYAYPVSAFSDSTFLNIQKFADFWKYFMSFEYVEGYCDCVFFTTINGQDAFYPTFGGEPFGCNDYNLGYYFYDYGNNGTKYPRTFYFLNDDGKAYYADGVYYEIEISRKNYKYSDTPFDAYSYSGGTIINSGYQDLTLPYEAYNYLFITQTLYNDDSNWEYWLETVDIVLSEEYTSFDWSTDDSILVRRYDRNLKKATLVNDKGDVLLEIPVEQKDGYNAFDIDIVHIHCETQELLVVTADYAQYDDDYSNYKYVTTIYSLDKGTTSVRAIARTESERMSVEEGEDNLNVRVNNAGKGENVTLSDMSGRVIGRMPASHEGASFNTARMPKGVYNVTLQGKEANENKKVMIK